MQNSYLNGTIITIFYEHYNRMGCDSRAAKLSHCRSGHMNLSLILDSCQKSNPGDLSVKGYLIS